MGRATALVIGGSVAGSFAARVLADHFERVIVFDQDELPEGAVARRGVPQGVHFHALLARGRMVAEELFPGFVDDLLAGGGIPVPKAGGADVGGWRLSHRSREHGAGRHLGRLLAQAGRRLVVGDAVGLRQGLSPRRNQLVIGPDWLDEPELR
jgi:glycine/D-amino acid oxidase-like deaminating enzyme